MPLRINLDYLSSTPLLPEVKRTMAAALEETGNPSSIHEAGRQAQQLLEQARGRVAALINAKPDEISFTSCGTESNNWALRGLTSANRRKGHSLDSPSLRSGSLGTPPHGLVRGAPHLIISAIEHPSISLAARRLEVDGLASVTMLPVDHEGCVSPSDLKSALTPETVLVSIMLANGEVGTIEPITELAAIAHEHGALFHADAIAAVGHWPVDVKMLGVDALSLAANQFYGPQGAAALFVRDGVRILPLLEGGGQERGARSGTEALPAIISMGVAAELAKQQLPDRISRLSRLRDKLRDGLRRIDHIKFIGFWSSTAAAVERNPERGPGPSAAGRVEGRLHHNLHVCIEGVSSESLVLGLDQAGVAAGLGSACNSKAMRPSHVLKAMGLSDEEAKGALVLTVGVPTTEEEIDRALEIIPTVVQRLRNVTALTSRTS